MARRRPVYRPETLEKRRKDRKIRATMKERERECRQARTFHEDLLFRELKKQPKERRRRQVSFSCMIVDIVLPGRNLLIEVDGDSHTPERDYAKRMKLQNFGFYVESFTNEEVERNMEQVIERILAYPLSDAAHKRFLFASRVASRHRVVEGQHLLPRD